MIKDITKKYTNGEITIVWKPGTCIHSGNCWRGLHEVFHPEQRPWITLEGSTSDKIIAQVNQCPSGALSFYYNEAEQPDTIPLPDVKIEVRPNGPLRIHARLSVHMPNGDVVFKETAASFCRCGHSKNKPFCDSSHKEVGFVG